MIYTVTLNPAIDKTVEIPGFTAGKVNRIQNLRVDAGGKGINVTKCLTNLGTDSTAAMLVGGSSGKNIQQMLAEQNIRTLAVSVSGETRTNLKINDPTGHSNTDINEPGPFVGEEVLDELADGPVKGTPEVINSKIASMACKSAVKGNTALSLQEAKELIDELLTLENPYHCPHGRPTIISMSKYEIEKKFKRIVT